MKCTRCSNPAKARGLCQNHYARFRRNGTPDRVRAKNGGVAKHPNYGCYKKMKVRCYDPTSNRYYSHGARGIIICERWLGPNGFWNFVEDMGMRPSSRHTVNRIDNDGNYEPSNCEWATPHQQAANTRRNTKTVGVNWSSAAQKWTAVIMVNRVKYYLGVYAQYEDAVKARKAAEVAHGI